MMNNETNSADTQSNTSDNTSADISNSHATTQSNSVDTSANSASNTSQGNSNKIKNPKKVEAGRKGAIVKKMRKEALTRVTYEPKSNTESVPNVPKTHVVMEDKKNKNNNFYINYFLLGLGTIGIAFFIGRATANKKITVNNKTVSTIDKESQKKPNKNIPEMR